MSGTLLEQTRSGHEDIERLERLVVKELQKDAKSHKDRLYQNHRVRNMIDCIINTTARLVEIYEDKDKAREDEIAALGGQGASGQNVFSAFYDRLKEIREYHRRHPNAQLIDAGDELEELLKEEPWVDFSGEEGFGRFLDMHELYNTYCNSKFGQLIEYSVYLEEFPQTHKIPVNKKLTSEYRGYLESLLEYLVSFFERTQPLQDIEMIFYKVETDFEDRWEAGNVQGWEDQGMGNGAQSRTQEAVINMDDFDSAEELLELEPEKLKEEFWKESETIVEIVRRINTMLRLVDSDLPCLGKVYEGMDRMIESIESSDIPIDRVEQLRERCIFRWNQIHSPLACAAYVLDPEFQGRRQERDKEVMTGWEKVLDKQVPIELHRKALGALGLKKGGTIRQRAERLFLTKFTPLEKLDRKHFAKGCEPAVKKTEEELQTCKEVALLEVKIQRLCDLLEEPIEETKGHVEKKQALNYEEMEAEREEEEIEAESESDDEEQQIYNPLKLPMGWDGKPIPYWLYKLHGLGQEFKCEICGNYSYWGRRAFERHFKEWRHQHGMRCLGIPNTKNFHEITIIKDAKALSERIQERQGSNKWRPDLEEEFEDKEGNVYNKKTYTDLQRQGLI